MVHHMGNKGMNEKYEANRLAGRLEGEGKVVLINGFLW